MDFLKAEIERKKRQIEESKVLPENKKYFKRGDLAARQEEEYWRKHKRLKSEEDDGASTSQLTADDDAAETPQAEQHQLSRKEVIKRLRERNEPIRVFDESDYEAYQRLKKLEMLQPEVIRGFKNDMKIAMDQVDQEYLNEILKSGGSNSDQQSSSTYVKVKDTTLTIEEILKLAEGLGKGDEALDSDVILNFLKLILKLWGEELNSRVGNDKRGFRGKLDSATQTQTVAYIKPLFRKLKQRKVSSDILGCLVEIVQHMLDRHYLKANDAYLEMAIGNAPWPIGVTMVGIHARTGREKIFARNVAHVLNDETQRKYIQALKRLITQCQKFFPTDPSRSVDFESEKH